MNEYLCSLLKMQKNEGLKMDEGKNTQDVEQ